MRAVVVDRWMEPAALAVRDHPEPELRAGQVLVDVHAAGCNFFDLLIVQGRYQVKPPFPFVPGAELAGVVREVAPDVTGIRVGDRVLAAPGIGAFAERAVVPAAAVRTMPAAMPFEAAAAFPIVYPTSWAGLVLRAGVRAGETVLVHAAAGGVGIAAVQIARALGARVIATAGGPEKLAVAGDAGAEVLIDYREGDWAEAVRTATEGRGADVIYDSVGGTVTGDSLRCIAWNGRLLVIGFASGDIPSVALNRVLLKNVSLVGLHWGAYAVHEPARVDECFRALFDLYERAAIRPVLFGTYALDQLPAALDALASRRSWGKIVVTP